MIQHFSIASKKEEFVFLRSVFSDVSNGIYIIGFRSVTHPAAPTSDELERSDLLTSGYVVRLLKPKYAISSFGIN